MGARLERGGSISRLIGPEHFSGFLVRVDHRDTQENSEIDS
jgi:hypothetical protein